MSFSRLLIASGALILLAACGGNNNSPPAQQAAATTTTAAPTAAPAAPAASSPAPAATLAANDPQAPLMGTWAADLSTCASDAITITPARFGSTAAQCDMAPLQDNKDGSFSTTLSCTGGGKSTKERLSMRPLFAPTGEAIGFVWPDRKNQAATVYRCGPAPAAR